MIIYLVVTSLILEMDFMEMFDMLDERPTGAAGQWKWNEPIGVFSQSLKNKLCDCILFICLVACFVGIHKLKDMNSLWGSICYGRYKQF
jgi:hypothetical protein